MSPERALLRSALRFGCLVAIFCAVVSYAAIMWLPEELVDSRLISTVLRAVGGFLAGVLSCRIGVWAGQWWWRRHSRG